MIKDSRIDGGKPFDWGLASEAYSKYRDIYPEEFYQKIISLDLCTEGQNVLDVGTGTGVLPRNLCRFGAKFTGSDISPQQIERFSAEHMEMLSHYPESFTIKHYCAIAVMEKI